MVWVLLVRLSDCFLWVVCTFRFALGFGALLRLVGCDFLFRLVGFVSGCLWFVGLVFAAGGCAFWFASSLVC